MVEPIQGVPEACSEPVAPKVERTRPLLAMDCFAGAGGFSLGAIAAGFEVCAAVESDHHASRTYVTRSEEQDPTGNQVFSERYHGAVAAFAYSRTAVSLQADAIFFWVVRRAKGFRRIGWEALASMIRETRYFFDTSNTSRRCDRASSCSRTCPALCSRSTRRTCNPSCSIADEHDYEIVRAVCS